MSSTLNSFIFFAKQRYILRAHPHFLSILFLSLFVLTGAGDEPWLTGAWSRPQSTLVFRCWTFPGLSWSILVHLGPSWSILPKVLVLVHPGPSYPKFLFNTWDLTTMNSHFSHPAFIQNKTALWDGTYDLLIWWTYVLMSTVFHEKR